jgi:hypothetical protein
LSKEVPNIINQNKIEKKKQNLTKKIDIFIQINQKLSTGEKILQNKEKPQI